LLLAVVFALAAALGTLEIASTTTDTKFLVWMCLERCGDHSKEIKKQLDTIAANSDVITDVSFEIYNLGPNSTLVFNDLAPVLPQLQKIGVTTWAMLSSFPHPKQFLDYMRFLFQNPAPFIAQCIAAQKEKNFTGFDVDFEPTVNATVDDAIAYAKFLDLYAREMHNNGIKVQVDIASWNAIWNWTALATTSIDRAMNMDTYVGNWTYWTKSFTKAVDTFDLSQLAIGIMSSDPSVKNATVPLTDAQLEERFEAISSAQIKAVGCWDMPIPDSYWPYLRKFRGLR